jgi:hypothetical protein
MPSKPKSASPRRRVEVINEAPRRRGKKLGEPRNLSWHKIYEAADRADFKGWFFLPTLEPAQQLNYLTRRVLNERIDYLYKNVGAVTMAIDGIAMEEVGTGLWPKWTTSSPEYNKAMTDRYHFAAHDPRMFSADGETDGYTAQYNIRRMIRLYGDCFGQLLRPGPGAVLPLMHIMPGWRIDNAGALNPASADAPQFRDGILRNQLGRAVKYQILAGEFGQPASTVEADDILHFHDPFLPGQSRGVSCLASVCKKLFRREDILKALNNGTLARERLGFAIQSKGEDDSGPTLEEITGDGEIGSHKNADGSSFTVARLFGDDADEKISIPRLPNNSEIKTIESNRPGTAVTDFLDLMLREVGWSTLYPPEYLFFIGGLGQGTVARLVLQRVSALVRARRAQQLIPQFCNRWHNFFAWQIIKANALAGITIPEDWWKHKVLADADKSVDIGREGKLYDDRVATGKMSIEHYHALNGEDAADVEDENFERMQERLAKLSAFNTKNATTFTYFDLWPRSASAPLATSAVPPDPEDPPPPDPAQ